jgi:hypothetical protein
VNPDIDGATGKWSYRGDGPLEIEYLPPEDFEEVARLQGMFGELRVRIDELTGEVSMILGAMRTVDGSSRHCNPRLTSVLNTKI